jgi:hypothetical protein
MKIKYQNLKMSPKKLAVIETANAIINEYSAQGFDLTLRQLYYQFVARDIIPNRQSEYKKLGETISDGRLAGLIDWDAIIDRTRNLRSLASWETPQAIIDACAAQFKHDMWENQHNHVEVWIEKDALVGVIAGVCDRWRVPYFSCRGYTSQSEMWAAGRRLRSANRRGKTPIVLHFGDHDPSGVDMTRDIAERLSMFAECSVHVDRLALNMSQIEQYQPPPNPTKFTDARAEAYVREYGDESWELDALDPSTLADLIENEVRRLTDIAQWEVDEEREQKARTELREISARYDDVVEFLS